MLTNVPAQWNEQANIWWKIQSSHMSHDKSPVETKASHSGTPCAGKGHLADFGGMEVKHMASAELIHSLCSLWTSCLHYPKQTMRHIAQSTWLHNDKADIPNMYQMQQGEWKWTLLFFAACFLDYCNYLYICEQAYMPCTFIFSILSLYFDFLSHTINYLIHTISFYPYNYLTHLNY